MTGRENSAFYNDIFLKTHIQIMNLVARSNTIQSIFPAALVITALSTYHHMYSLHVTYSLLISFS